MKILFIGREDGALTQMATALFRRESMHHTADSAGVESPKNRRICDDSKLMHCMNEDEYDLSRHEAQTLTADMIQGYDRIITFTRELPLYLIGKVDESCYWKVDNPDPREKGCESYRKARAQIKVYVDDLLRQIEPMRKT